MISSYENIFTKRANAYQAAMKEYPEAREEEFKTLIEYSKLKRYFKVADIPSGSCYLKRYIEKLISEVYFIEPTQAFLNNCSKSENTIQCQLDKIPIEENFFDRVFSLAGSHHIDKKINLYKEIYRILKKNGQFIYADVLHASKEDSFLNHFVNQHNSLGHNGIFIEEKKTLNELRISGFKINSYKYEKYHWNFSSKSNMVIFIKNLFGLDKASIDTILNGLENILGYKKDNKGYHLSWGLYFIVATKP